MKAGTVQDSFSLLYKEQVSIILTMVWKKSNKEKSGNRDVKGEPQTGDSIELEGELDEILTLYCHT